MHYNLEKQRNMFDGTNSLTWESSVVNTNLISRFTNTKQWDSPYSPVAYTFEFKTMGDILVQINGSEDILIPKGSELELTNIWSFVLKTDGVQFYYFAQY